MEPVRMAILTTDRVGRAVPAPRWPQRSTFRELIAVGRPMGVDVFVAAPTDFDWNRGIVHGYTVRERGDRAFWVRRPYPLPDVLYNRVPSRTAEGRWVVRACLARMSRRIGPALFNPFYLNKASVFRLLARDPAVAPYLPPTRTVRSWADVEAMLNRYGRVYLKPARGSLGNHTVEITDSGRDGRRRYRYRYNLTGGRTRGAYARHLDGVRRALHPLLSHRPYVVQKAIPLARLNGRPFDVRALVQKNEEGVWTFTGAAARVAGPGQITTHVPRGGRRMPMDEALTAAFGPADARVISERAAALAEAAARAMEAALQREFMEMSMDVGVDDQQRLWIFELNSKPLRFDERDIQRRWVRTLIYYVRARAQGKGEPLPDSLPGSAGAPWEDAHGPWGETWTRRQERPPATTGLPGTAAARRRERAAAGRQALAVPGDPSVTPAGARRAGGYRAPGGAAGPLPIKNAGSPLPAAAGAPRPAGAAAPPGMRPQSRR